MFCYASSAVNGGAKAGITTCSLSTDFIISVPDGADNEWKVSMYPTLKTYFFSDLFGFHDQYETLFDDAAESWIGIIYFRDQIQGSFTAGRPFKLQLQSVG
mgnify:CR=1 FL=1